jgi:hypothetical protein
MNIIKSLIVVACLLASSGAVPAALSKANKLHSRGAARDAIVNDVSDVSTTVTKGFQNIPTLQGMLPSPGGKTKLIMAVDTDYPPYAYVTGLEWGSGETTGQVAGIGVEMINAMAKACDFEVETVAASWSDCWTNTSPSGPKDGTIGQGLLEGWYHGCMTFTHPYGARNRYSEFTKAWAVKNKPAGLITRLVGKEGSKKPWIGSNDTLLKRTIVDVTGWAPTADTLKLATNRCNGKAFEDYTIIQGSSLKVLDKDGNPIINANDKALTAVLDEKTGIDAMWIYADQAFNYQKTCDNAEDGTSSSFNCTLWKGFGDKFAYIQTGLDGWLQDGTTIAMSKKGTGVAEFLNTCFDKFQPTKEFYEVCAKDYKGISELNACKSDGNPYFSKDPSYKGFHQPGQEGDETYAFNATELTEAKARFPDKIGCEHGYCTCSDDPESMPQENSPPPASPLPTPPAAKRTL